MAQQAGVYSAFWVQDGERAAWPRWARPFIESLRVGRDLRAAARAAGVAPRHAAVLWLEAPAFAAACEAAQREAADERWAQALAAVE